jgi:hypothetical protein
MQEDEGQVTPASHKSWTQYGTEKSAGEQK